MTPNWDRLRLLGTLALPVILASCVPAQASTDSTAQMAKEMGANRPTADDLDAAARERISRRVAELLAPVTEPATPFDYAAMGPEDRQRSLDCLSQAIYYEARSEPDDGQRAVAQVVLNRVRHPAFPNTVCGVVFQGSERRTGCQFTFTCDGSLRIPPRPGPWEHARRIAAEALAGAVFAPVGNATHYHTLAVHPYWASYLRKSAIVGAHIFYRWAGTAGEAAAFHQRYGGLEPAPAFMNQTIASGTGGVTVHAGTPSSWLEEVALENGASVTIHRGGSKPNAPAIVETPTPAEPIREAVVETESYGVTIHRGGSPTG